MGFIEVDLPFDLLQPNPGKPTIMQKYATFSFAAAAFSVVLLSAGAAVADEGTQSTYQYENQTRNRILTQEERQLMQESTYNGRQQMQEQSREMKQIQTRKREHMGDTSGYGQGHEQRRSMQGAASSLGSSMGGMGGRGGR